MAVAEKTEMAEHVVNT